MDRGLSSLDKPDARSLAPRCQDSRGVLTAAVRARTWRGSRGRGKAVPSPRPRGGLEQSSTHRVEGSRSCLRQIRIRAAGHPVVTARLGWAVDATAPAPGVPGTPRRPADVRPGRKRVRHRRGIPDVCPHAGPAVARLAWPGRGDPGSVPDAVRRSPRRSLRPPLDHPCHECHGDGLRRRAGNSLGDAAPHAGRHPRRHLRGRAASGFERPALSAFEAQVIPREDAARGISYVSSVSQVGSIAGPTLGGIAARCSAFQPPTP